MIGSGPVISGPVLQDSQTGSLRRNRSNRSVLASAFQNAWKQGTMAAEVGIQTMIILWVHTTLCGGDVM